MINLDFSLAVALYILFTITIVFAVWFFNRKQKTKDLSLDAKFIWFCAICTHTYINTKENIISICPKCGSYNKK